MISACIQKSGVDPSDILGIGCTGHGKGLYLVDSAGAPAYYGIPPPMPEQNPSLRRGKHRGFPMG